jgi:hypothetical protein
MKMIFASLYTRVTSLKHEGFKEELEWRAVYNPQVWNSALMRADIETVGGIPQHVYKIPLDAEAYPQIADLDFRLCLDRVIVGPSQYPWVIAQAFGDQIEKMGVPEGRGRVRVSGIPLRP